jgi:hypothetical protein
VLDPAPQFPERDGIFAGILNVVGGAGVVPLYPPAPHCNELGLSDLGRYVLDQMMARGMVFDPDHMSARARHEALDHLAARSYDGIISSHTWSDDTIYPRILEMEGMVTPYAGDSTAFVEQWRKTRDWAVAHDQYWGIGYGADTNGFGAQGGPRGADAPNPVTYPFTGFGGVVIDKQVSGRRTYDVNVDGVAHYGLYPDWVEDLRRLAGDEIVRDLERGAESYLQTWERATGVPEQRCHDAGRGRAARAAAGDDDRAGAADGRPARGARRVAVPVLPDRRRHLHRPVRRRRAADRAGGSGGGSRCGAGTGGGSGGCGCGSGGCGSGHAGLAPAPGDRAGGGAGAGRAGAAGCGGRAAAAALDPLEAVAPGCG